MKGRERKWREEGREGLRREEEMIDRRERRGLGRRGCGKGRKEGGRIFNSIFAKNGLWVKCLDTTLHFEDHQNTFCFFWLLHQFYLVMSCA